ncbi:MAG: hypothetical protein LBT10_08095 [Methanobrevibacter sp.]|jgi:hypothetical protein|nr:hypothetical protein [Methanobrevibacter sp.]
MIKKILSLVTIFVVSISLINACYFIDHEKHTNLIDMNNTTNITINNTNVSIENILDASQGVKKFKEENETLPAYVMVDDENCSMEQFLYLISKAIINTKLDNNSSIEVLNDIKPSNSTGDNWDGEINKITYILNATKIVVDVEENREVPDFLMTEFGNVSFNSTVYGFAVIGDFIKNNGTFPETISFNATEDGKKYRWNYITDLANWLYENHEYNVTGDCYIFSDIIAKKLAEQGYQCGIIQGTTELGNHRAVMVIVNGERQWFETCRCVKSGWGINPNKWNEPYITWKPESLYKSFNGFTYP